MVADKQQTLRLHDIIEPMPSRWDFAVGDPEQRYDWQKVGLRRSSGVLLNFPNSLIAQKIAWPDKNILPNVGQYSPAQAAQGSIFYSQLFKNATHTLSKHVFGNVVRSMSTGYSRVSKYRLTSCIGDELLSLALTLRDQDTQLAKQAEHIQKATHTPLGKLSTHLADANALFSDFVQGRMVMSPSNLHALETACRGIAELCDQKAGLHDAINPHWLDETQPPSTQIRHIFEAANIDSSADAFRFLAYVSCLVADGSLALSTQDYYPQDQLYLGPDGAVKAAREIAHILNQHQLRINRGRNGQAIIADAPPSAMLKPDGADYKIATPEEIVAVANDVKQLMQRQFGNKIDRLLDYADRYYDRLETSMSKAENQTVSEDIKAAGLTRKQDVIKHAATRAKHTAIGLPTQTVHSDQAEIQGFYHSHYSLKDYLFRPETRWEMGKLYGRFLPQYFFTELVQIANRSILGGTALPNRQNLLSAGFNVLTAPISNSVSNTVSLELFRKSKHDAVGKARTVQSLHEGAFKALLADHGYETVRNRLLHDASLKDIAHTIQQLNAAKTDVQNPEYYHQLAEQFRSLALVAHEKRDTVLSEFFGIRDEHSLPDHVIEIAKHGAKTKGDALLMLGFVKMLIEHNTSYILSMEYVSPEQRVWDDKELNQFSGAILSAAKKAGLIVKDGQLLQSSEQGFKAPDTDTLIRFANLSAQTLMNTADLNALLHSTYGTYSEAYMDALEGTIAPKLTAVDTPKQARLDSIRHKETAWSMSDDDKPSFIESAKKHLTRPEFRHEIQKEFERNFIAQIFHFPTVLIENYLLGVSGMIDGKKSVMTTKNLKSATLQAVTLPIAVSYGALSAREATRINKQIASEYANNAQSAIDDFANLVQRTIPHINDEMARQVGSFAQDVSERSDKPDQYLSQYVCALHRLADDGLTENQPQLALRGLSANIETQAEALAFLMETQKLLGNMSKNVNVLRYVAPDEASASPSQIRDAARFIETQTKQAMREPDVGKAAIRLARLVGEKLRSTFPETYLVKQVEKMHTPHRVRIETDRANQEPERMQLS